MSYHSCSLSLPHSPPHPHFQWVILLLKSRKTKKEIILATQGEGTLRDKNPLDMAVRLCWNWSPWSSLLADMHPTKGWGTATSENQPFLTVPFPPHLNHTSLPPTVVLSFIQFLFHLCCYPWDLTLQTVLLVPSLYWCCLVPLSQSVLSRFFTPSWFLDLPRWKVLTFRLGFWKLFLVLVPQGPMLATVALR